MDKIDEIRAKIEQNQDDRQKLIDEEKALLEELEAAHKPKLRHGDIKMFNGCYCVIDTSELKMHAIWDGGDKRVDWITEAAMVDKSVHKGTLKEVFDDLKRNSEDLRSFEIESSVSTNKLSIEICGLNPAKIDFRLLGTSGRTRSFTIEKATKIAHSILQQSATAKRDEAKKS